MRFCSFWLHKILLIGARLNNKLGPLSLALRTNELSSHGSQYPGWWLEKRIFSSQADHTGPEGWGGLWHDQPPRCLYAASKYISFFSIVPVTSPMFFFVVEFFYLFIFLRGVVIIRHVSQPPSVSPWRGPANSQDTRPWLMRSVSARKDPTLTLKLFLRLQNFMYIKYHPGITVLFGISCSAYD